MTAPVHPVGMSWLEESGATPGGSSAGGAVGGYSAKTDVDSGAGAAGGCCAALWPEECRPVDGEPFGLTSAGGVAGWPSGWTGFRSDRVSVLAPGSALRNSALRSSVGRQPSSLCSNWTESKSGDEPPQPARIAASTAQVRRPARLVKLSTSNLLTMATSEIERRGGIVEGL